MKAKSLSELRNDAKDKFSFILVYCPKWPSYLKQISTAKVFNDMIDLINPIFEKTKSDEAKQWLKVCLQEVRQSWKNYEEGKLHEGAEMIQQAEGHFDNAFSKKPMEPRFVAGESGAAFDSEKGFSE